ncbi:hypothetical protein [Sinorhizobium meliloti]|uniref:hypothetical protein n=1 Tax=Rhizobium meliloti TaxID=382 RepID=UPI00299E6B67|nr:hypothetical protein [Sinorhizobium meliloti]
MNAPSSTAAANVSTRHPTVRSVRYFAVTYFDGDYVLGAGRQFVFRSKRLTRAKRIARSNMPMDADRMELVEINWAEFDDHREAYRQRSGRVTVLLR